MQSDAPRTDRSTGDQAVLRADSETSEPRRGTVNVYRVRGQRVTTRQTDTPSSGIGKFLRGIQSFQISFAKFLLRPWVAALGWALGNPDGLSRSEHNNLLWKFENYANPDPIEHPRLHTVLNEVQDRDMESAFEENLTENSGSFLYSSPTQTSDRGSSIFNSEESSDGDSVIERQPRHTQDDSELPKSSSHEELDVPELKRSPTLKENPNRKLED
ncbi:MAG: hypothetical protein ABGZ17_28840 [Planctomycetaceae bacterium]